MTESEPKSKRKSLMSNGLIAVNLLLVAAILYQAPAVIQGFSPPTSDDKPTESDTGKRAAPRVRKPSVHLPLQGMAGFDGDDTDACLRMQGFLLDMDYELAKADLNSRVPIKKAIAAIKAGRCAVNEPDIATAIAALNTARVAVGLMHLPPKE
jgi:hypothetical protein